ncbi:hypothetical protein FRC00_004133, partial [Tulasnella sp. 408]
ATLGGPVEQFSDEGVELQFGTNVLGPAHFTLLLLPELIAGARSSPDGKARVVNVSSSGVYLNHSKLLDWEALESEGTAERRKLASLGLYNQSKYGILAFSNELARRYADQGITSNALNPVERGPLTSLYVGTSPETKDANGGWFIPFARESPHYGYTKNPEIEAKLWNWIEEKRKGHY